MSSKLAIRRLMRDLKELKDSPLPEISIQPFNDDLFTLHANIRILEGIYKGIIVHLVLNIPTHYPQSSPSGSVASGFPFDGSYHHHIYPIGICNDYLSNFGSSFSQKAGSGWTPSVTLKSLLMVLQPFLAEPDFGSHKIITKESVEKLRAKILDFECECGHTGRRPLPPFAVISKGAPSKDVTSENKITKQIEENLVCSISKLSLMEDDEQSMILGYPLHLRVDARKRLWTTLIPEMICYEEYARAIQSYNSSHGWGSREEYRSATGQLYTNWLPVYINEEHFQRGIVHCKNCISVVSNGMKGIKENDFKPKMVLRVLPALLNNAVVAIMKNETHESESAIYAYTHFLRLLMKFIEMYPELQTDINREVKEFVLGKVNNFKCVDRSKSKVPNIGEFIVKLFLSTHDYNDKKVKTALLEEYFARQIFWMKQKVNFSMLRCTTLLRYFEAAEVSNRLLAFNILAAKTFIIKGVTGRLDANYGLPPSHIVQYFQNEIKKIKNITAYNSLISFINYSDVITSAQDMVDFLKKAINISNAQGYTKI